MGSNSWGRAFERVEPGEKPIDPPEELKTWTRQTMVGLLGGMFFGAYRGILKSRTSEPDPIPANSVVHRTAMFIVRDGVFTGARIGLFVSMFSALSLVAHRMVGREHVGNFAAAGAVTCGLFGAAYAGPRHGLLPAAALGGAMSAAAAFGQQSLEKMVEDSKSEEDKLENALSKEEELDTEEKVKATIDRLIERFESNLEQYPTKSSLDSHVEARQEKDEKH